MKKWIGYEKGVNFGGWFSQCDNTVECYENFIKEEDFKVVAGWGVDHVRIPVDYNLLEDEQGNYKESGFEYLDRAFNWAFDNGLNVILDLHKTAGYSFDPGEKEAGFFYNEALILRFIALWRQFSERYAKYGDKIAFELLNEVVNKEDSAAWNAIAKRTIEEVRKAAPTTKILVGSYWNNSAESVKDLDAPYDENIVFNFHCYAPLIFTHQGAYWIEKMNPEYRISFPMTYGQLREDFKTNIGLAGQDVPEKRGDDEIVGEELFEDLFKEAIETAEKYDVALYCGEYGTIDITMNEDMVKWYQTINAVFTHHNIGRSAWVYRGLDFELCGERVAPVLPEILKYL